ncbi:MAG: hypothetical protein HC907_35620 [Richelia sp. SM1_7_0]|nr:hypothetical protein [Richelia sp. SM1_7_0]
MNSSIITQINIESSKVMLNHAFHKKILLLAYDEYHCTLLEKLTPLIAAPWFLGCQLFVKSQWIPTLRIDDIPVVNYEIIPSKNMLKACKYHEKFIKAIYEAVKELQVIVKSQGYSIRVPAWIGLIVNDIVTYNVHSICVDECLDLDDIKIYHNNIKENLIAKQKVF